MRKQPSESSLFLVRVWAEEAEDGQDSEGHPEGARCHGKVQQVVTREAHSFDGWSELLAWMTEMLRADAGTKPGDERRQTE
jgi:hypothetical protein